MTKRLPAPHRRNLSEQEEQLIEQVLVAGEALLALHAKIEAQLRNDHVNKEHAAKRIFNAHHHNSERYELDRFRAAEPFRWAAMGRADIQKGLMSLIRAIEQPARG